MNPQDIPKNGVPKRSDISAEHKWRLEDMFSTDADWETAFIHVQELLIDASNFEGELANSARILLQALCLQDTVDQELEKVYVYARMRKDEDNTRSYYQGLSDKAQTLLTQVRSAFAFMNPEILAIPTENLQQFISTEPGLQIYRHALADLIRQKPHVLSPAEEMLLAQLSEVAQAPATIFTMINDADMKYPTITDENGHQVEVTKGRYAQLLESKNRQVRCDAFAALYSSYEKQRNTLASTLNTSVKNNCCFARIRKYESALHSALDNDNLPISVYDNLIKAVRENLHYMHRYVDLRQKMLDLPELHMYDIYTPLVPSVEIKIPYNEAQQLVITALSELGDEYTSLLEKGLRSAWVDVYENEGKTSGAYSWGAYGVHPYVLLNYQDNLDNVFTLAHELGHAMHTYYSNQNQPYVYAGYTLFLAEVASTVNENLLMHYLLKVTSDRQKRMYLINHQMEGFRTTIYRQTMFAEFEKIIHETVEQGEPLTADYLCQVYRQLNRDYYGENIVLDAQIDMEWARIPHFYRDFYVYKYATGYSAATALAMQVLHEGKPAVERYLHFLAAGSSDYPLPLLQAAGVDMSTPAPVESALQLFGQLVQELEELA